MKEVQGRNHLDPGVWLGLRFPISLGLLLWVPHDGNRTLFIGNLLKSPEVTLPGSAPVLSEGVKGGKATWNRAMQREEQLGEGGAVINQTWQLYQEREPRVAKPDLFRPIANSALEPPRFHLPETRPQGWQAHSPHMLPTCNEDAPGSRARLVFTSSPAPSSHEWVSNPYNKAITWDVGKI